MMASSLLDTHISLDMRQAIRDVAKERRPLSVSIVPWDNDEVCFRAIRVTMTVPGGEVIPSRHRRIAERTFDLDTSVRDDVPPKTLRLQLLPTLTASCHPKATVFLLVSNSNTMILAQVATNILGHSLKFITTKRSFVVPTAKKGALVLMKMVIIIWLETNSTMVVRRGV